jgi:RNA polymerase sigma-70 factor (sigma-E family)
MTFEQYATARLPVLLRTARAICADASLAEDLLQDVLIKLHANWDRVGDLDGLDAYVRRMLVNEFISWRRKWARFVPHADLPRRGVDPDLAVEHAERDALWQEVRQLPPRQRVVIGLRYFADLPDSQIAAALGCSESTVRVHAGRALARLRIQPRLSFIAAEG